MIHDTTARKSSYPGSHKSTCKAVATTCVCLTAKYTFRRHIIAIALNKTRLYQSTIHLVRTLILKLKSSLVAAYLNFVITGLKNAEIRNFCGCTVPDTLNDGKTTY